MDLSSLKIGSTINSLKTNMPNSKIRKPISWRTEKCSRYRPSTLKIMKKIHTSRFLNYSIVHLAAAEPYAVTEVPEVL